MSLILKSTAVAAAAAMVPLAAHGAMVSNPNTLPAGVNIDITDDETTVSGSGNGTQARWRGGSDQRGVVQTAVWNTAQALDGFGLLFDDFQNSVDPFDADQDFILDVQLLTDDVAGGFGLDTVEDRVVTTVASETFTIEPGDVSPSSASQDSYLYIDLDSDPLLVQGSSYAFHLYAVETPENVENQRLYFAETGPGDYNAGFGRQTDGQPRTTGQEFPQPGGGLEGTDLAFFTVAVPEPSSLALVGLGGLMMLKRRRKLG